MQVSVILQDKGTEIFSVSPGDTVFEAIQRMSDKNVGALLVLNDGELCGIISERDYRDKVILKGRTSKTTEVSDIMTSELYCVSPEENIKECMALMTEKKIRHLPVLQGDAVVGVISIGDLVKQIISDQKVEINHLRNYITGTYPG